jgi:hypothetical protein
VKSNRVDVPIDFNEFEREELLPMLTTGSLEKRNEKLEKFIRTEPLWKLIKLLRFSKKICKAENDHNQKNQANRVAEKLEEEQGD